MINIKYIAIVSLMYCISCVAPKQPALNAKEEKFIKEIEEKYKGNVTRGIDVILLTKSSKDVQNGSYGLNTILPCNILFELGKDSITIQSEDFFIAKRLYNEVLEKDIKYKKIWISFSCDTANSNYKDLIFVYKSDTLFLRN